MSLQVWLPLTKDLRNQGLSDLTFSILSSETAIDNNGKLGKCYTQSALNGSGGLISNKTINLGQNQSMFCWFRFVDLTSSSSLGAGLVSQHRYPSNQGMGITIRYVSSTTGYLSVNTGNGSGRTYNTYYGTTLLQANTWYHGGYTYDGSTIKIYVNGVCEKTQVYSGMLVPADYISCFNWSMSSASGAGLYSGYKLHGSLNDVRIYDHCLSPMEVKELAKGLVLHYPLNRNDWGQENLASQYIMPGGNSPGSTATAGRTNYYGDYGIIIPATENADTYFSIWYSEPLESGAVYTLSAEVSGLVGNSYYSFPLFAQGNTSMGIIKFNHNGLNTLTFTMNYTGTIVTATINGKTYYRMFMDDSGRTIASGQGAITIKNIKLEKGSIATPWCPNSSDALATTMGLNGTTEYDCSGFCNNGEKVGTFTYTSDTSKYAVSQNCLGTNYIHLTPPSTEILTMAIWVNWKTIPSGQSVIFVDNGSGMGLGLMNTGILCSTSKAGSSYTFSKSSLVANTWYHFVVVKTGTTTRKLYINGVEQTATSNTSNWTFAVNELQLGKRSTTSDGFIGKLSDFRAYATALSAEDVKSLYQNCATIDPDGTIRGQIRS